ncbi:MAG: hypothetical protein V8S69_03445 [Dakarella massiliensis]
MNGHLKGGHLPGNRMGTLSFMEKEVRRYESAGENREYARHGMRAFLRYRGAAPSEAFSMGGVLKRTITCTALSRPLTACRVGSGHCPVNHFWQQ